MNALNPNVPMRRPRARPRLWIVSMVITWLALATLPVWWLNDAGLQGSRSTGALTSQPGAPQPGMPIYVPIV